MISRGQRILFWTLLVSSVVMAVVLLRMRERAMDRLLASAESMPLNPSAGRPAQSVTMMIANDMDGSLQPATQNLALPVDGNARAHVILQHLILDYARPNSKHPIAANKGVNGIFFMTLPLDSNQVIPSTEAIVDLSASFVAAHPSGIEPETLTLLSITRHAARQLSPDLAGAFSGGWATARHACRACRSDPGLSGFRFSRSEAPVKIGVFDSGFGGLTVLRALLPLLPQAEFLYLGDTARLPYGSKSRATIVRYALSSTRFLLDQGADFLVIACNTASALALKEIQRLDHGAGSGRDRDRGQRGAQPVKDPRHPGDRHGRNHLQPCLCRGLQRARPARAGKSLPSAGAAGGRRLGRSPGHGGGGPHLSHGAVAAGPGIGS